MKEKLTFEQVKRDVTEKCKRDLKLISCLTLIVILLELVFSLKVNGALSEVPRVSMTVVVIAACLLFELYVILRFVRARQGKLIIKQDVFIGRETKSYGFLSRRREAFYFKNYGRFFYGMVSRKLLRDLEGGESVYLVFTGVFPNVIAGIYSAEKYEADFVTEA